MAGTTPAPQRAAPAASTWRTRQVNSLRVATFAILVTLVLQYSLGMYANLFATLPRSDRGKGILAAFGSAVSSGPVAVSIHAVLGLVLGIAAIFVLVRAVLARHVPVIVLAVIGLVAIGNAAVNGATFVGTNADGNSMDMAMSAGGAILVYVIALFLLRPQPR